MHIINKQRYKKQYVIGGSGIFDSVSNLMKKMATSNVAKALANAAQTELGKKAVEASKTVAKEIGLKAIDVGKDVAIAKAKALIDKAATPVLTQQSKDILESLTSPQPVLTQQSKAILESLTAPQPSNITNLLEGSAISIQDLARKLNGGGLKLA